MLPYPKVKSALVLTVSLISDPFYSNYLHKRKKSRNKRSFKVQLFAQDSIVQKIFNFFSKDGEKFLRQIFFGRKPFGELFLSPDFEPL